MLGYSIFSNLLEVDGLNVYGTVRSIKNKEQFFRESKTMLIQEVDVSRVDGLVKAVESCKPEVVINCIGLIKQHDVSKQHVEAVKINSLLPHQIAKICDDNNSKLIHFSTDCVFDGEKGGYVESDNPNANDLYGRSKQLGEVDYGNHLTLRTSIIGHELSSNVSLVDWFLSQEGEVKGFKKAVFSGLPTSYIAKILSEHILKLNTSELTGLYHLSADPIDKYSLLSTVSGVYKKEIEIHSSDQLVIDRSLDSSSIRNRLGLSIPSWPHLIEYMHSDYVKRYQ